MEDRMDMKTLPQEDICKLQSHRHCDEISIPSVQKCHPEDADHTDTTMSPEDSWRSYNQFSFSNLNTSASAVISNLSPVSSINEVVEGYVSSDDDDNHHHHTHYDDDDDESTINDISTDEDSTIYDDESYFLYEDDIDKDEDDDDDLHETRTMLEESQNRTATRTPKETSTNESMFLEDVATVSDNRQTEVSFRPIHRLSVSKRIMADSDMCTLRRALIRASLSDLDDADIGTKEPSSLVPRQVKTDHRRPRLRRKESICRSSTDSLISLQKDGTRRQSISVRKLSMETVKPNILSLAYDLSSLSLLSEDGKETKN
jgi:hypothetical protein